MIVKKFKMFQGVRVISQEVGSRYYGKKGCIAGFSEDEDEGIFYSYGVFLHELEVVAGFKENQLEATGEQFQESDFFDGTVIHVSQKGEILPPRDE